MPQMFSYNNYVSYVTFRMYVPVLMLCELIYYMIIVTCRLEVLVAGFLVKVAALKSSVLNAN